nr:12048_t:CDS:2 [Entrophospora candida]
MSEVKQDIFNTTTIDSSSKDNKISNEEKTIHLQQYETRSVEENTEPWKPHGPWYKDVTKRRWFTFGLIAFLIAVVIIVGLYIFFKIDEQSQYNNKEYCQFYKEYCQLYKEYCLFSNSSEEADNYFFGSSPMVEDDNSNLNTTIKELNLRIKNIFRADPIIQKIVFNGRKVAGGDKDLQYYGIKENSVLHLDLLPFSSSPSSFKDKKDKKKNIIFKRFINPNFINKLYDNAFTLYNDFKYSSSSSQYFLSWNKHNSIANQGNILLRQLQHQEHHLSHPRPHLQNLNNLIKFSDGMFTTPDLKLAELYSKIFYFKGEKYKRFDIRNDRLDEYWVSPRENELKPFDVLVKKVKSIQSIDNITSSINTSIMNQNRKQDIRQLVSQPKNNPSKTTTTVLPYNEYSLSKDRFYNAQVSSLQNVVVKNEPSTTNITTNNHKIPSIKSLKLNNPDIQDLPSILQIFVNGNVYNHALIQYKNVESVKNAIEKENGRIFNGSRLEINEKKNNGEPHRHDKIKEKRSMN